MRIKIILSSGMEFVLWVKAVCGYRNEHVAQLSGILILLESSDNFCYVVQNHLPLCMFVRDV